MTLRSLSEANLADELAVVTGSKLAEEVMRLFEHEPDLLLDYLKDRGRLIMTSLAYRPGASGVRSARNAPLRDFPPAAVPAAENPHLELLWRIR